MTGTSGESEVDHAPHPQLKGAAALQQPKRRLLL